LIVCAVVDDALSPDFPLGDSLDVVIRREDAERFVEEVRGDDPEVAAKLRIDERELEGVGGLNGSPNSLTSPHVRACGRNPTRLGECNRGRECKPVGGCARG
jgi:hypothetical protein